jgi:hypothetical protein
VLKRLSVHPDTTDTVAFDALLVIEPNTAYLAVLSSTIGRRSGFAATLSVTLFPRSRRSRIRSAIGIRAAERWFAVFSANKRIIACVANSSGLGPRGKCAGARCSIADTAIGGPVVFNRFQWGLISHTRLSSNARSEYCLAMSYAPRRPLMPSRTDDSSWVRNRSRENRTASQYYER